MSTQRTLMAAVVTGILAALSADISGQDSCSSVAAQKAGGAGCAGGVKPALYQSRESLQETLLSTRRAHREWLAAQPPLRQQLELGPWWATRPLPEAAAATIDPQLSVSAHETLWSKCDQLADGKVAKFRSAPAQTRVVLKRTILARQPGRRTVGIGGGDHLEVWLNGRPVVSAQTHLISGRYGCGSHVDGTRVDQLVVDLDLAAGENVLCVRMTPAEEPSFYFSAAPNPVPRFWEQARRDFPAAQNPLLDLVYSDWLDTRGWFAARETALEEQLVERLAADCHQDGPSLRAERDRLRQAPADRDDRRWLDLCVKSSVLAAMHRDLGRLRAAVEELGHLAGYPAGEFLGRLDDLQQRLQRQAALRLDPSDAATAAIMREIAPMQRHMLVDRNPLLRNAQILFVKRYTYNSKHYYDDFQHVSRWGGGLCVLSLADGSVRSITTGLEGGVFDRYDLSFDARRIVFGYRRPRQEGFRLYEIGVDSRGLRPVTQPPADEERRIADYGQTSTGDSFYDSMGYQFWTDDVHPCYLPDGGLCFASTRCEHGVLCTPLHYLACTNLYRLDAAGLRPISRGALSEFTPTMMEDGRILYNRWEYVYKGVAAVQPLWTMRPDGSGSEEFYGDDIANPGVFWQARQVPGHPRLAVCIGCGHEPLGVGQVLLLDLNKEKRTPEPMISLSPNVKTHGLRGLYQLRNGQWREDIYGPFYADPYPLSDKFFLVACNPQSRYNDPAAYGIHLLDAFGNCVPIYHDPEISCWEPMPLRPRQTPTVLPDVRDDSLQPDTPATVFLSDVYRGLPEVRRGTVKYLRVMEQIPKPWAAEIDSARCTDRGDDGYGGHVAISRDAHIWVAVLRGVVPVREDGSACFEVPPRRNLFFQALDSDFMEVQRMRTFVSLEPGERRSCIGCHEHRVQAPVSHPTLAADASPAKLAAQPGEVAPRPLYYPADVQPVLDRHCVRCHDGKDPKAPPDLRGEMTTLFNRSYENILQAKLVKVVREWNGGDYAMQNAETVPPYTYGSHASRLVEILRAGHYEVQLSKDEWIKLVTWIDCGAPYYGSYFGRRNIKYQGQPDFRPVPTVDAACGIPPAVAKLPQPEPIPAELLAWWPLEEAGPIAVDASGHGHEAAAVNTIKGERSSGRAARRFDGRAYIDGHGLGKHDAVSVALWVKAHALNSSWSPLVFGSDIQPGVVHFSLRSDGAPNVAINTGGQNWTHRKARVALTDGNWHHLVLVCDARVGGSAWFYVDGRLAGRDRLDLGIALDYDHFRIGAWNRWQNSPDNNFHGEIAQVRIYRGMLTGQEAAELAKTGR